MAQGGRLREVAVVSSSSEALICVLDPRTGSQLATFKGNTSSSGSTALVGVDHIISAQKKGSALHIWSWGTEQPRLKCHAPERIGPLAVSGDGAYCVGGGVSGRLYLWEVGSGALVRTWDAHYKAVSALCFSLDGCFIFSGAEDAMASCWGVLEALDCDSGNTLMAGSSAGLTAEWSTGEHTLAVTCIGTSQAGDRLITASLDRTAKMYEAATGEVVLSVLCPSPLRAVCCDANENFLFMGAANGTIYQLDTSAAAAAATMADATAISLGTKRAAAAGGLFGSEDRPGAAAGASLQELVGHQKAVTSLACTVDGSTIVSCAEDGAVRTWHVASRQCLLTVNVASAGLSQVLLVNMPAAMFFSQGLQPSLTLPVAPFKKHIAVTGAGANAPSCPPVVFRGSSGEAISGTVDRAKRRRTAVQQRCAMLPQHGPHSAVASQADAAAVASSAVAHAAAEEPAPPLHDDVSDDAIAALEAEVARLRDENRRWQAVNSSLMQKLNGTG